MASTASGLTAFYGGGQVPDGPDGSKFYKMGTQLKAGATATISVAPSAMPYLRLQQGPGPHDHGEIAFTFQACPGTSYTGWIGGFDITGPTPVCVALDIRVTGETHLRHLFIPFGGHAC